MLVLVAFSNNKVSGAHTRQSFCCSHTQSVDVDEESDSNLDLNPAGHARIYAFKKTFSLFDSPKFDQYQNLMCWLVTKTAVYDPNMRMIQ